VLYTSLNKCTFITKQFKTKCLYMKLYMDYISTLPVYDSPVPQEHSILIDTITQQPNKTTIHRFFNELRLPIIFGIVFFILSLPYGSEVIQSLIPYTRKRELSLLVVKTAFFVLIAFILTYNK